MRKLFTILFAALMSVGMYATTYTVTFTNLNSVAKVVENITLPHTFSCDYTNGNGELDLIIQETYNETGGRCSTTRQWPWGGNDDEVVVGHDDNNHFVTINAPFVGTSFMSGYYDGSSFGEFYYSFHITIAAAEPEQKEGIENIVLTEKAQKVIVDGMIYIVRDGKLFDMTGAQVK